MKFKEYEKKYEDLYTSESIMSECKLELISTDKEWSLAEYKKMFDDEIRSSYKNIFNIVVRYYWLQRRFFYNGLQKEKTSFNGYLTDSSYSVFLKNYIGINHRIITRNFFFGKICSYFKDFFKNFDKSSPFQNPEQYEFPYKNITIDFLLVVYQMKERLYLLDIAEERKMSFAQFLDYLLNYISCYNEEHDKDIYSFINGDYHIPYIRDNFSKGSKKADKRKKIKLR